jgi:hypothetical protein
MINWDSYLEPPDETEGEVTVSREVACTNELCEDFDKDVQVDLEAYHWGNYASAEWQCLTCKKYNTAEFEVDEEDFGFDPDAYGDMLRDEGP